MDTFARALRIAHSLLTDSVFRQFRAGRYASFDSGKGAAFESGKLSLEDLSAIAATSGEPEAVSGKQEMLEQLINMYI